MKYLKESKYEEYNMKYIQTFLESFSDSEYFRVYDIIREMDDELDIEYMEFGTAQLNSDYITKPGLKYRILRDKIYRGRPIILSIKNTVDEEWYKSFDDSRKMKSDLNIMKKWIIENIIKRLKSEGFNVWYHESFTYSSFSINILIFMEKQYLNTTDITGSEKIYPLKSYQEL